VNALITKLRAHQRAPTITAPTHLSPTARAWWLGIATTRDLEPHQRRLLTIAAEQLDLRDRAAAVLRKSGLTFRDRHNQPKPRPEVAIQRDAAIVHARLVRELCLNVQPADSRSPGLKYGPKSVAT
jgi:phage terminase small subunit